MNLDPRIIYAAERTLLAWIRTSLAMMGLGFVVARFSLFLREIAQARAAATSAPGLSPYIGTSLIGLGVLITVFASIKHRRDLRKLVNGEPLMKLNSFSLGEVFGFALSLVGAAMVFYLMILIK